MTREECEDGLADERYMESARRDPAMRKYLQSRLASLGFHLWCMTRDELDAATVGGMRQRKRLLHGYITDAEIASEIDAARARVFHPLPDSTPFFGADSDWHAHHIADPEAWADHGRGR